MESWLWIHSGVKLSCFRSLSAFRAILFTIFRFGDSPPAPTEASTVCTVRRLRTFVGGETRNLRQLRVTHNNQGIQRD